MKLLMEQWRSYIKEFKDRPRFYPPGEAPGDPTPEEEERNDYMMQTASEKLDEAHEHPNELIGITSSCFISYDPGVDEYMVYYSHSPVLGNYDDLFNSSEEEGLMSLIVDKLSEKDSAYQ